MKKVLSTLLIVALVLALAAPAAADPLILYATRDNVPVYMNTDTGSTIVATLKRGEAVLVEQIVSGWYGKLVKDPNSDGQIIGWIQAAELSTTPPCAHVWGEWTVTAQPTCTKTGFRFRVCTSCGDKETEEIAMLPHNFGEWYVQREPTCTMEGLKSRWCRTCGYEQVRTIEKLPHRFGEWVVTVEATDHSAGVKTQTCLDCGFTQQLSFDPEGTLRRGDRGDDVYEIQQLLVAQGYLDKSRADKSFGSGTEKAIIMFQKDQGITPDGVAWPETIRRLHHDFGDWEVVTPLTRFTDGESIRVCRECGYTEYMLTAATPFFERGDNGYGVKTIQRMLNDLGFNCGSVDGAYGTKLERAWESLAAEKDVTPEIDRLRPGDLDLLVNTWIENLPAGSWKGVGDKNGKLNLVLTVKLTGVESGIGSFDWSVSNLGREKGRFIALLFTDSAESDFSADNQVAVISYDRLKASGDNRLSGSFSIPFDGTGTLRFCAIATADADGAVWSSNVVSVSAGA